MKIPLSVSAKKSNVGIYNDILIKLEAMIGDVNEVKRQYKLREDNAKRKASMLR